MTAKAILLAPTLVALLADHANATFHLMQIEQVIGGVGGEVTAQAIQLRMRTSFQNFVAEARIYAWDAAGQNPILIHDFTTSVPNGAAGARILIASSSFLTNTTPTAVPNFPMTNLIPASYLAAGSLTFEDDFGSVYWRLSWGGAAYTGDNTGLVFNDSNGNFGPPFPGPLPSSDARALRFQGAASTSSTTNAADYALTTGPAVFINNAGASFTVTLPSLVGDIDGDGDVDLNDHAALVFCLGGPDVEAPPFGCSADDFGDSDLSDDGVVDILDYAEFQNLY